MRSVFVLTNALAFKGVFQRERYRVFSGIHMSENNFGLRESIWL